MTNDHGNKALWSDICESRFRTGLKVLKYVLSTFFVFNNGGTKCLLDSKSKISFSSFCQMVVLTFTEGTKTPDQGGFSMAAWSNGNSRLGIMYKSESQTFLFRLFSTGLSDNKYLHYESTILPACFEDKG